MFLVVRQHHRPGEIVAIHATLTGVIGTKSCQQPASGFLFMAGVTGCTALLTRETGMYAGQVAGIYCPRTDYGRGGRVNADNQQGDERQRCNHRYEYARLAVVPAWDAGRMAMLRTAAIRARAFVTTPSRQLGATAFPAVTDAHRGTFKFSTTLATATGALPAGFFPQRAATAAKWLVRPLIGAGVMAKAAFISHWHGLIGCRY